MRRSTATAGLVATVSAALVATALVAGSASATPTTGSVVPSPAPPPEAVVQTRVQAHDDGIRLAMPEGAVVRDFTLTYGPGSDSGWHQHPGVVLATVVSGTVTRAVPCRPTETFTAGQAFVEVGPHRVRNAGADPAVLSITQIAPPGTTGGAFREDLPEPICPPHRR